MTAPATGNKSGGSPTLPLSTILQMNSDKWNAKELRRLIPTVKTVSFDDLSALEFHEGQGMRVRNSSFFLSKGGSSSAMMTLICSTLGASVLTLPYAFSRSGIIFGILLLLLCGGLTIFSIYLLVRISDITGSPTYEGIAGRVVSPQFQRVVETVMIIFCFGVGVGYIVAVRDTLSTLQQVMPWYPHALQGTHGLQISTALFWLCLIFPLSCFRRLSSLRFVTFGGVICVGYVATFIIAKFAIQTYSRWNDQDYRIFGHGVVIGIHPAQDMVVAIPLLMFSFCCQPNVLEVYTDMKEPSVTVMTRTGGKAIITCSTIYMISASCGYCLFGDRIMQNILGNFNPWQDPFAALAFAAMMMALVMATPLCILPTREACSLIMCDSTVEKYHVLLTFAITGAALVLSLMCPGIASVFGVLGGACGSLIGFIFPAIYALRCDLPATQAEVYGTWFMLVFGVIAGSVGTWVSLFPHGL